MKNPRDIWQHFTTPSEILSVEHCFGVASTELYGLTLSKTKNQEVERSAFIQASSTKEIGEKTPKGLPMVLRLTGRKVLSKKTTHQENESVAESAQRAFTNVDLDSLYLERVIIGEYVVVSAIRTDTLEELLKEYKGLGLNVIGFSLGVYGLFGIMEQLQLDGTIGHYDFKLVQGEARIREDASATAVSISGELVDGTAVVSFLSGLLYLADTTWMEGAQPELVEEQAADWRFKTAYKKSLPVVAIGFLCLLLISFLAFNHYYNQNQQLQTRTAGAMDTADALKIVEAQVQAKEAFLKNNAGGGRRMSEYSDRIGASVPKAIALEQLILFPLKKALKREQLFEFSKQALEVKGACSDYGDFQEWMETLNQLSFVEKIEVVGYGETDRFAPEKFYLRLILNP